MAHRGENGTKFFSVPGQIPGTFPGRIPPFLSATVVLVQVFVLGKLTSEAA